MNTKNRLELLVNDPVLLGQSVDAVIGLSHPPDGAADGVGLEVGGHAASGLVNLGEVELDACVVLGGKNTVAGGTFPRDVKINILSGFVLHDGSFCFYLLFSGSES